MDGDVFEDAPRADADAFYTDQNDAFSIFKIILISCLKLLDMCGRGL